MAIATPGYINNLWLHNKLFQNLVTSYSIISYLTMALDQEPRCSWVLCSESLTRHNEDIIKTIT